MTPGGGLVEQSRLRTWETEPEADARPAWAIILKYSVVRAVRTWWIATILVLFAVGILVTLGGMTYELGRGSGMSSDGVGGAVVGFAWPSLLMAVVLGAPLFADDIRFNAPLFYFSRPVERVQYVYGKAAFLAALFAALTLVPLVLSGLLLLGTAPFADPPQTVDPADVGAWRTAHVDSLGDALFVFATQIVGVTVLLAFLASATLLASSLTRRGWHAALALVAGLGIWGMLGLMATEFTRTASQHLFGPAGWLYLILYMPLRLRFEKPLEEASASADALTKSYEGAGAAILLAYLLVAAFTAVFAGITLRRMLRQGEGL